VIRGFVDGVAGGEVKGWVRSEADEEPIAVSLKIDDCIVETRLANAYREDMKVAEGGTGRVGFCFTIPHEWRDGRSHSIAVTSHAGGIPLPPSDGAILVFQLGLGAPQRALFAQRVSALLTGSFKRKGVGRSDGGAPVALLAFYSPNGKLSESQRRLLEELAREGFRTILCFSTLSHVEQLASEAEKYCSDMLFRSNFGRDFASWCILSTEYWDYIHSSDIVLFANDSFIGPFSTLSTFIRSYEQDRVDFFGATESWDVKYHIQSSLFILSKQAVLSREFESFVHSYAFPDEKAVVIKDGEIKLSEHLCSGPLSYRALIPYEQVSGQWLNKLHERLEELCAYPEATLEHQNVDPARNHVTPLRGHVDYALEWFLNTASAVRECRPVNAQHVFWREIIEDFHFPFLKKELLLHNPSNVPGTGLCGAVVRQLYGPAAAAILYQEVRALNSSRCPPIDLPGSEGQPADKRAACESVI